MLCCFYYGLFIHFVYCFYVIYICKYIINIIINISAYCILDCLHLFKCKLEHLSLNQSVLHVTFDVCFRARPVIHLSKNFTVEPKIVIPSQCVSSW